MKELTAEINDISKKNEKHNSDLSGLINEEDVSKKLLVAYQEMVYNINGIPNNKDIIEDVIYF